MFYFIFKSKVLGYILGSIPIIPTRIEKSWVRFPYSPHIHGLLMKWYHILTGP